MTNTLSTSKFVAALIGASMVLSFAFALPAKAATAEELQAQIQSLLATIASLQAQLAGISGGSTTGGSTGACGVTFTQNHSQGDSGGQVMDIQKFLNGDAATQVATTGAGSPGNETSYFGPATKAGVIKFQEKYASDVLAPVGLTAGTGYWGPSSMAKANAMTSSCTSGGGTVVVPTGTGLTVSAAAQPGNSLAPSNAANVPFTRFTVTNNSSTAQTIESVTVELTGLAEKGAFSSVVLLDEDGTQIGLTRTLNSNDQANIGDDTVLAPGASKTFTVAGNIGTIGTTYAGEVGALAVVAINTSATVSGTLPISGAQHTLNGTLTIGTVDGVTGPSDPGSDKDKEVGTTDYTATGIKLTAGSGEDVRLHSIRFNQSGSAAKSDISDVTVTVDGTDYTPTLSSDGKYYTVNFGSGIVIKKGLSKEVTVSFTIVGGSARTVAFDIYKYTDIVVTGETYGYGITVTDGGAGFTSTQPVYDANVVTITGGTFNSVSKSNEAPAANIAVQKSDEILGAFTVDIKGESITVGTLDMTASIGGGPVGTDLDNVTLVDQDGTILAGPEDAVGSGTEGSLSFSSVEFPTGVTTLFVKGYLDSTFGANDTIAISTNPNLDWSNVTGNDTGDSITLPSATSTANTMTVQAVSLSATTLTQPAARSVVKGVTDFVWATAALDASNSGEDVKITAVTIQDTTATTSGATAQPDANDLLYVEIWADLTDNGNDSVRGDKFETKVSDTEQFAAAAAGADPTLALTLENQFEVAKNTSTDIAVVADLSASAVGTVASSTHTVDVSSVTAQGANSGTDASDSSVGGGGQAMTIQTSGTLTTSLDSSSPSAALLLDDTSNEQTLGVFRLAANNVEDIRLDYITITGTGTTNNEAVAKYVFYNEGTKVGELTNTGATVTLYPTTDVIAPAGGYTLLTVKGVMNNIDGTAITNSNTAIVGVASAAHVVAIGVGSGTGATEAGTGTAATHIVMEAVPTFAFDNDGLTTALGNSANYLVGKVVITNTGNKDIKLDNGTGVQLAVNWSQSGQDAAMDITLKDSDGNTLATSSLATSSTQTTFTNFEDGANSALTISGGSSETVYIYADTSTGGFATDGDTLQAWLDDTAADLLITIDGEGGESQSSAIGDKVFKGDIFGPVHVNPS